MCSLNVRVHKDVSDFQNETAFPEYKTLWSYKTLRNMIEEQKRKYRRSNESGEGKLATDA